MSKTIATEVSGFSDRIRILRLEKSLSATDLAKLAQVTPAAVWHWEHDRAVPRHRTIANIARKLGVSEQFLLMGRVSEPVTTGQTAPLTATADNSVITASLEILVRAIQAKGFTVTLQTK